ncbi:MAG: endo-1,4-beta-xylanase, partial [Bacillota bacterium]|nr:endo-1,4-beta-xylanase [Bacillota bacterium]
MQRNLRIIVRIAFLLLIVVMASGCWLFQEEDDREVVVYDMPSLREIYEGYFEIGAAVSSSKWSTNTLQNHRGLIKHHFSSLTAENEMKPDALQGHEGRFTYNDADQIVDFAIDNDMKVRGHTLVWHAQTPNWFFKDEEGELIYEKDDISEEDRQLVIERLENHIEEVMTHYGDKVYAWDVVNEAVTDDWRATHRDDSPWYDILGDEFMEIAFRKAHEVNPNAKLFYNDYNAEMDYKLGRTVEMLSSLLAKDVVIHGVGIQGHWNTDDNAIRDLKRAIEEYTALGIKEIHITELDVGLNGKTEDQQA